MGVVDVEWDARPHTGPHEIDHSEVGLVSTCDVHASLKWNCTTVHVSIPAARSGPPVLSYRSSICKTVEFWDWMVAPLQLCKRQEAMLYIGHCFIRN